MQSLRDPVVKLQRVEEIYPSLLRESTIRLDLRSVERNEAILVQLEMLSGVTEEENRQPTNSPLTDCRNCVGLIKFEPDSVSEICVTTLDEGTEESNITVEELSIIKIEEADIKFEESDTEVEVAGIKVEELVDIKEENPEPIKFPPIKTEPENCIDLQNSERCCDSGMCATPCEVGNEVICVQLEGVTEVTGGEDCEATSPLIRTDAGNCVRLTRDGPDSGSEACGTAVDDGTEEGYLEVEDSGVIREENPLTKTFIPLEAELDETWNEPHHAHTNEHGYSCYACSMAFNCEGDLMRHKCLHDGDRRYCCDVCSKVFTQESNLIKHKRVHSGERPYCCDVCSKMFTQEGNLIRHKRVHSGERPYCCDVCSKMFTQKGSLITHKRLHSGERPYCCDVCNEAFAHKCSLKTHKRLHNGERPYCCDVCSKKFTQKSNLITHKIVHSGDFAYLCDVCGWTFTAKSHLVIHQRVHSGEHPYSCDVCNKAFTRKNNLITHKRVHSGERPYFCEVCNEAFAHKCSLKTHIRLHSGERP